ncbi:inner membrane protein YpjD [Idiomarina sp. HP20-50]|uniref:cytochrome C assembly family protein n=1 Tax=Idiomarina sp. HP20-50 TaxID=3070813 RepID=UPI00294AD3D9|nr:cytochrome c biogenesis protein CcsA [Idiomarina sp. HP20-50]MDV6317085.1 cytochrome c biogenesis protein CcsA [Idiomarina sp. HP20-50]
MLSILLLISLLGYSASAFVILQNILKDKALHSAYQVIPATLAVIAHGWLILYQLSYDHFNHINISSSLAIVAFLIATLTLLKNNQASNLFLKPVIYLFAALTTLLLVFTPVDWGNNISTGHGLVFHITLSLVAYGILALATLYALQTSYLNRVLKNRKGHALLDKLPPLMTVEKYFFNLLVLGTFVLFLALGSGFIFLDDMFAQQQAHKTILTSVAALIYLLAIVLHRVSGLRGRLLVILTVIASTLLTLGYFGSRFVKDFLLS